MPLLNAPRLLLTILLHFFSPVLLTSLVAPFLSTPAYRTLYHVPSDTSSRMHLLHAYALHIYCLIPSSSIEVYLISISAGLEIEALIEISVQVFLHAWREKRFVLGAWDDHVACALWLNAAFFSKSRS